VKGECDDRGKVVQVRMVENWESGKRK
jgi:hypothetical protein